MVYSIFVTHCFVNNSVKGVSVTVFDKDDIQMHGMTYEGKHHKMQQTETKYVQKTFYSLLHYYVIVLLVFIFKKMVFIICTGHMHL